MIKITVDKALLEQAIEALAKSILFCDHMCEGGGWQQTAMACHSVVAALRAALAKPGAEPVAEVKVKMVGGNAGIATVIHEIHDPVRGPLPVGTKLFASPPPPAEVPLLTDEEIRAAITDAVKQGGLSWLGFERDANGFYTLPALSTSHYQLSRAVEALVRRNAGLK